MILNLSALSRSWSRGLWSSVAQVITYQVTLRRSQKSHSGYGRLSDCSTPLSLHLSFIKLHLQTRNPNMHPTNCNDSACMSKTALRRHLDLTDAKSNIPATQSALPTARVISDINAVSYPEGVSSPNPALNQHTRDGKFRCVSVLDCLRFMI